MPVAKGVWGIDLGQCALKALRLELVDGKPTATAFDYVEHAKILTQPDADPDALIREALDKFLSRNQVKLDDVVIGVSGQSGLARFVKLPPVEEKKIAEIVKFEAKQQIPFPLDEVVWDFQKVSGGEAVDGFALETEIGLFAMKRDVISKYLGYFGAAKIEVHTVQMAPLALVNFATYELLGKGGPDPAPAEQPAADAPRGKKQCTVVMDIGTDASNLIITDGAKIIWQRPIPLGGNHFTRALTKELKLTFAKAEHLKRNAAKSPEMAGILRAIKPVLTDFVGEVSRSLGYFTNTHRDAHVAYLVGLGSAFKLPGLQKYLGDKLSLEVRKPAGFARLGGEGVTADPLFQENLLTFPVAYGLALQGLGQARLSTNLLPHEIRTDRLIRAKKPYAVAAAAMLLIGTAGLALGFSQDLKSVTDPQIKKGEDAAKAAGAAYGEQERKFGAADEAVKTTQNQVRSILAGQEERLNWARFFEVQTAAMPRPGTKEQGGNLTEVVKGADGRPVVDQPALWRGAGDVGVKALDWFQKRMAAGVRIEEALEDAKSDFPKHLATVNVEAVHTRWVTDPGPFLLAADTAAFTDYRRNISEYLQDSEKEMDAEKNRLRPAWKPTPGEEVKGVWVVEIRGYTDHDRAQALVKDGLVRNLQKFDQFAKDEGKVGRYIVGVPDPVKGRVSHAFAYNVWQVEDAAPTTFRNINVSYLDRLVDRTGAAGPGFGGERGPGTALPPPTPPEGSGGEGQPAAAAAPLGPPWRGLSTLSAGTGAAPAAGNLDPTQKTGEKPTGTGTGRRRFEFVVMLLWREPIPSGSGTPIDPATAAPGAPGGTPGPGAALPPNR